MSELAHLQIVEALWDAFDRFDFDAAGTLLHDDFVCEWPQSGERIRGRENFVAINQYYPGQWRCTIQRILVCADEVVTETQVRDGDEQYTAISFFTLAGGKIVHVREYWPDPYPAPEWRAQWVERM
jgi:ketosteroid isomerase-like protein